MFNNSSDQFFLNVTNNIELTGNLTVLDGARITADTVNADSNSFSTIAEITLSGENSAGTSLLLDVAKLSLGDTRRGSLRVQDGASAQIGNLEMDRGEIVIAGVGASGTSSLLSLEQEVSLGINGSGGAQVLQAASFETQTVYLGNDTPITVDGKSVLGTPSRWNVAGSLTVNTSDLVVSNGAEFDSGSTSFFSGDIQDRDPESTWTTSGLFDFNFGRQIRHRKYGDRLYRDHTSRQNRQWQSLCYRW